MPEAGRTPSPTYERGKSLAYGEASDANSLMGLVASGAEKEYTPTGQEESFLLSPTKRPQEPITAGAPFGAGPDATPFAIEPDDVFLQRVAAQIQSAPRASKETRAWAARALAGE